MVLGQILKVGQVVYKYRKAIYTVLTAQDRYIKSATTYGRWSKSASYGWRSGAVAGSFAGAFITNADDSPGNGIQTTKPVTPSRPSYQTRNRQTSRSNSRYSKFYSPRTFGRCPNPRKYKRSRNRFNN